MFSDNDFKSENSNRVRSDEYIKTSEKHELLNKLNKNNSPTIVNIIETKDSTEIHMDVSDMIKTTNSKNNILEKLSPSTRNSIEFSVSETDKISTPSDYQSSSDNDDYDDEINNDIDVTEVIKPHQSASIVANKSIEIFTNIESDKEIDSFEDEVTNYLNSEYTGKITIGGTKITAKLSKEPESVFSEDSEIKKMTSSDLNKITDYTAPSLKKIAKNLSLPITKKVDGTWKQYNKKELYNNIKDYLAEKKFMDN